MQALAAKPDGLSATDRLRLDYALGKAYADFRDHSSAFKHWASGASAKRSQLAYDENAAFAFFEAIERVFTTELVQAKSGWGDPSQAPIFILGMPRSGSSLVEQILASHPAVYGAGELRTFNDVVLSVRDPDGAAIPYPDFVPALDPASSKLLGSRYVSMLRALAPTTGERVTDKMPANYFFVGLIHLLLPNATIIHTIRNAVDTCFSCFSTLFVRDQNHTYDLGEIGRYYKRYERLMAHWRRVLPPGRFLDVNYEELVEDLDGQARRLLEYCGLPWDERCLEFHRTERPIWTASTMQVRQPIYKSSIGRARAYEAFLAPLIASLGN